MDLLFDGDMDRLREADGDFDGLGERLILRLMDGLRDGEGELLGCGDREGERDIDGEWDGDGELLGCGDREGERDIDWLRDGEGESLVLRLGDGLREDDGVAVHCQWYGVSCWQCWEGSQQCPAVVGGLVSVRLSCCVVLPRGTNLATQHPDSRR